MRLFSIIPSLLVAASLAPSALAATTPGLMPRLCTGDICEPVLDRRCCLAYYLCKCPTGKGGRSHPFLPTTEYDSRAGACPCPAGIQLLTCLLRLSTDPYDEACTDAEVAAGCTTTRCIGTLC